MFKRIFLFILVNFLVMITINLVLSLLGVHGYLNQYGIDYQQLAIFCLVWGMGGSFISLLLSKVLAKSMMGVQIIEPDTRDPVLQDLVQMVHNLSRSAGLDKMPEVGVYDSPELNAFATGPSRSSSLVAVSSGLLGRMNKSELEGVIGHEISHIANGDMVTMTLLQGVINAFVMFLSRALAFAISQAMNSRDDDNRGRSGGFLHFALVMVFEIFFSFLGMIVVAWFSRYREFRADAGSAKIAGRDKMILALQALQREFGRPADEEHPTPPALKAFQISSGRAKGFVELFSTHPKLEDRINALELMRSI